MLIRPIVMVLIRICGAGIVFGGANDGDFPAGVPNPKDPQSKEGNKQEQYSEIAVLNKAIPSGRDEGNAVVRLSFLCDRFLTGHYAPIDFSEGLEGEIVKSAGTFCICATPPLHSEQALILGFWRSLLR